MVIKLLDGEGIAFSGGAAGAVIVTPDDSIERLRNGDPMARLELIAWGMLAAYREATAEQMARVDSALAQAPNIQDVLNQAATAIPGLMEALQGADATPNQVIKPSGNGSEKIAEGAS